MSNLPKETIDKIKAEAAIYQQHRTVTATRGYIAGATEWAGRAQGLVDALEIIDKAPMPTNSDEREFWINATRATIVTALAKYKEENK
jgi:hypothetical protein